MKHSEWFGNPEIAPPISETMVETTTPGESNQKPGFSNNWSGNDHSLDVNEPPKPYLKSHSDPSMGNSRLECTGPRKSKTKLFVYLESPSDPFKTRPPHDFD